MTLQSKSLVRDNEPLPEAFQRYHEGSSGSDLIALVVAPDGSGLLCRPVAGKTTVCERLSHEEMVRALTEVYGLNPLEGH